MEPLYVLLVIVAITTYRFIQHFKSISNQCVNNVYIRAPKRRSINANYELVVYPDDILNKFLANHHMYSVSEEKPLFDLVLMTNPNSTMLVTAKIETSILYNNFEDVNSCNIECIGFAECDSCGLSHVDKELKKYHLQKYVLINADIDRKLVNGAFQHYMNNSDDQLIVGQT